MHTTRNGRGAADEATSRGERALVFARNFFRHPRMLGSVIPSSRYLVEKVLRQVDWRRARVMVEYGPGVGTFTGEILERLSPAGHLVVFETNDDFVRVLRESFDDPRLHVIHGSAADIGKQLQRLGLGRADYVISGIPFSTMPDEVRDSILKATRAALAPDGRMLVYQFSGRVRPHLERVFGRVTRGFEPRNILPAQLFFCTP